MVTQTKPPLAVVEYDFSYSVTNKQFRWRYGGDEWLCARIAGTAWCRYANNKTHHLDLVCQIDIDQYGAVTTWGPEGEMLEALKAEPVILNTARADIQNITINEVGLKPLSEFPQGKNSHWRMCSVNWENAWRLRDEREKENGGALYIVNGYRGMLNFNWMDGGSHVFADNTATIDGHGIVHFG